MESKVKANLFIPGVGKSATSSLHLYLNQHQEISMSEIKETHFFCIEKEFEKGLEYYNSLFPDKDDAKYYGESCTSYIGSEIAIERIKKHTVNPKFIIVLRNPIDRIYSHYSWLEALNKEKLPFREAILKDKDSIFDPNKTLDNFGYKHYLYFSKYAELLEKYIAAFGKENILIILTENLKRNPLNTVNQCFTFLNLRELENLTEIKENVTNEIKQGKIPGWLMYTSKFIPNSLKKSFNIKKLFMNIFIHKYQSKEMSMQDRMWLINLLKNDVLKLRRITGLKFSEWNDFHSL
jgi:hypothetical protein